MMKPSTETSGNRFAAAAWVKKAGWALPLFFLIKGLLWLAIPLVSAALMID